MRRLSVCFCNQKWRRLVNQQGPNSRLVANVRILCPKIIELRRRRFIVMGEKNSVGVNYFYRLLMTTSVAINRHALPAEVVTRTRAGNEPLFGWFSGPGYTSGNPLSALQHTSILLSLLRAPL